MDTLEVLLGHLKGIATACESQSAILPINEDPPSLQCRDLNTECIAAERILPHIDQVLGSEAFVFYQSRQVGDLVVRQQDALQSVKT